MLFSRSQLSHSLFLWIDPFFRLNEEHFTFHLQYKHSGTFANHKYQELSTPKNPKMCNPILVTLLKMRPHYGQSSRENGTPSSGTSPLASYKEVPPPPPGVLPSGATCVPEAKEKRRSVKRWSWSTNKGYIEGIFLSASSSRCVKEEKILGFLEKVPSGGPSGPLICFSWLSRAWYFHACLSQRCKLWQKKMNL